MCIIDVFAVFLCSYGALYALFLLQIISELPTSANGNFDIHWYRKIPGVIAAASFDGKIGVHNLEVMRVILLSTSK
jgi:hypothetical protein